MKKIYYQATCLTKTSKYISKELFKYRPLYSRRDRISINKIANEISSLMYHWAQVRKELLELQEKNLIELQAKDKLTKK